MGKTSNTYFKDFLLAFMVSSIGYMISLSMNRTGLVDIGIEGILFLSGSIFAFVGWSKSGKVDKNFRKFELFYGLTYLTIAVSLIMGIYYYIINPNIIEITVADIEGNNLLMIMSSLKTIAVVLLMLTWSYFYKYLNLNISLLEKITTYLVGVLLYFTASMLIWWLTNDVSVLSLGIMVGLIVGIFALIAKDKRTRYLTLIFTAYNSIHLIDFYHMGKGYDLSRSITNPIYWGITVLYVLEVRRWINIELKNRVNYKCSD